MQVRSNILTIFIGIFPLILAAQDPYQIPPKAMADLVDAPQTPSVAIDGSGDWMVLLERPGYPSIEELAQPELRLAGLRINPRTNGPSRGTIYHALRITGIQKQSTYPVTGLPDNPRIQNVTWSPDGKKIAFTLIETDGVSLWLADSETGKSKRLTQPEVNDIFRGQPYQWFSDSRKILFRGLIRNRGEIPAEPLTPVGPTIQQATGDKAPVRTYQDLLRNAQDEDLFEYYGQGQLYISDTETEIYTTYGDPGIISSFDTSPDGNYVLVNYIKKPFSYIVPYYRFPQEAVIYDLQGNKVRTVADIPLAENIPKGFGAVRLGPRNFQWRNDVAATLYWAEAQDGGDPAVEADIRDKLYYLSAPFDGEKLEDVDLTLRFSGIHWGDDQLAITYEWWWNTRTAIASQFQPGKPGSRQVIFERSFEDRYNDPGDFETVANRYGRRVLMTDRGSRLILTGLGASPQGNRPFVRTFDLKSAGTKELWRSQAPFFENPVKVIDPDKGLVLTRRESREEPPNYFLLQLRRRSGRQLTFMEHPYPQLASVEKQIVKYKRKDGVDLKGDLYLPPGHKVKDGPLPVIMWAYPNEYKSADAASQVEGSPYEFIRLRWGSPLYFLTQGYAVFDDPSMPVIGEGEQEPNDSFRGQLVMNAEAAVDKLVEMKIADRKRIAIGGHSYGAFMTANLLAHSDLFAAGIARSGAYNRTLTPFGFQAEERTYWEAPQVYYTMSPFMHSDKINEPILLIHGEADNNSGTFPVQSQRFFAALKGLGADARLVLLPHESHGYRARESILHMLWEMNEFLEKHVKAPRSETTGVD